MDRPPLLLLVDDAPEIARLVVYLGRRCGQEVVWRGDVPGAWEYLREPGPRLPDLILLDRNLPGADGLELFCGLRGEPAPLGEVRVALFSQWSATASVAEAVAAGIDFVVAKELTGRPNAWKERIEEVLRLARLPSEWSARSAGGPPRGARAHHSGAGGLGAIRRALRHPALRRCGPEVVAALCHRAVSRILGGGAELSPQLCSDVDTWISSGKVGVNYASLIEARPGFVATLALSLSHQVECLFGSAESEPPRAALAAVAGGNLEVD